MDIFFSHHRKYSYNSDHSSLMFFDIALRIALRLKTRDSRKIGNFRKVSKRYESSLRTKKETLSILMKNFLKADVELLPWCTILYKI